MPCWNPPSDPRGSGGGERGSAPVEFLTLGVLLLVPLIYLVLTLAALQGASFAAEGAARHAARALVLAPSDPAGRAEASAVVRESLLDWRVATSAARTEVRCSPNPGDCLQPRGHVTVTVRVAVALPFLPRALAVDAPGTVPVEAHAVQSVSMFRVAG